MKVKNITSCNVLAENKMKDVKKFMKEQKHPRKNHSKIFLGDFCFFIKFTSYKSSYTASTPKTPQFKFNILFNEHFP